MFEFMFGGKQRLALIKELIELRMVDEGFSPSECKLQLKSLSNFQLTGTPEGVLVFLLASVMQLQKKGILLNQIIAKLEDGRRKLAHNPEDFNEVIRIAKDPNTAGLSVPMYCRYRIDLEFPGKMSDEQFRNALESAISVLPRIV